MRDVWIEVEPEAAPASPKAGLRLEQLLTREFFFYVMPHCLRCLAFCVIGIVCHFHSCANVVRLWYALRKVTVISQLTLLPLTSFFCLGRGILQKHPKNCRGGLENFGIFVVRPFLYCSFF